MTCLVDGCNSPTDRRGCCTAHYMRILRYGSPTGVPAPKPPMEKRLCAVDGCDNFSSTRGFCGKHNARFVRHGNANHPVSDTKRALKFLDAVRASATDECIEWPFARSSFGYAVMAKYRSVHVQICTEIYGPRPSREHEACHDCGNGKNGCVNPRHLMWKTRSENQMDRVKHGTSNRGERQWNSKLTQDDVMIIAALAAERKQNLEPIAKRYGVAKQTIDDIFLGRSWSWLTGIQPRVRSACYGGLIGVRR